LRKVWCQEFVQEAALTAGPAHHREKNTSKKTPLLFLQASLKFPLSFPNLFNKTLLHLKSMSSPALFEKKQAGVVLCGMQKAENC
jgi:hypothetical protein